MPSNGNDEDVGIYGDSLIINEQRLVELIERTKKNGAADGTETIDMDLLISMPFKERFDAIGIRFSDESIGIMGDSARTIRPA